MTPRAFGILLLAGVTLPSTGVQAKLTVESKWQGQGSAVSIDGSAEEWSGTLTYIEKAGVQLGARNDDDHLYLCLVSTNREIGLRALLQGLIVEIGDKLTVQFPIGSRASRGPKPGGPPPQAAESLILTHAERLDPMRLPTENEFGVEARLATESDFVYELKVPLKSTEAFPYAVDAGPGAKIIVRVDAPDRPHPEMNGGPGGPVGGMPGGGMGGGAMGGGMPGGGRPGGTEERSGPPEPMRFKVKVLLAGGCVEIRSR